jgi:hypothetical protein
MFNKVPSEFFDNILFSDEGSLNTVGFAQAQRHTTAGTTITDGIIVITTFNNGMDESTVMAIAQDIFGVCLRNKMIVLRTLCDKDIAVHPEHNFRPDWIFTLVRDLAARAGTDRQFRRHVHNFFRLLGIEQVSPRKPFPPPVPHPAYQATKQRNLCPRRPEKVELQGKFTVSTIECESVMHYH